MTMSNDEIVAALVRPEVFPEEALLLAMERRAEIAPLLIEEIEAWGNGSHAPVESHYYLADIACHLLAEWRDTRGFKPLLSLLASEDVDILGDSLTENVPWLLPMLFDGDEMALRDHILNPEAGEFARNAMLEAYVTIVQEEAITRDAAHGFLEEMFATLPHDTNFVWSGFAHAVAELQFEDMVPQVKRLFDMEAIDITWLEYSDFEDDFASVRIGTRFPWRREMSSPVESLANWRYIEQVRREDGAYEDRQEDESFLRALDELETVINPHRDVGRNDPCPCGSGKKFKKCCLDKIKAGEL